MQSVVPLSPTYPGEDGGSAPTHPQPAPEQLLLWSVQVVPSVDDQKQFPPHGLAVVVVVLVIVVVVVGAGVVVLRQTVLRSSHGSRPATDGGRQLHDPQ